MWHTPAGTALSDSLKFRMFILTPSDKAVEINRQEITGFSLSAKPLALLCCHEIKSALSDSSVTSCLV